MANWWANKIAQQGRPVRPAFPRPPVGPGAPPGYSQQQPLPPPAYAPQAPQQQQQQQEEEWHPNTLDPTKMSEVLPIWHYQGNPRGGAGETAALGNCPACGSPRFFSRSTGAVMNSNTGQMATPKPECTDCGYPNEQGTIGAGASASGNAAPARQGIAAPPPGSIPLK